MTDAVCMQRIECYLIEDNKFYYRIQRIAYFYLRGYSLIL